MTKFNPENKSQLTYEESLGPAMKITDQEDAAQYFRAYVDYIYNEMKGKPLNANGLSPTEIAKTNLGYYAGYYDRGTRLRVEKLFDCQHPFLGKSKDKDWTSEEILELGIEMGKKLRK